MRTPEEAWELISARAEPLSTETVTLEDAIGRVARERIVSAIDLPPFDNSAMDGYAIRSKDTLQATVDEPVQLHVVDTIPAGSPQTPIVEPGISHRIMTGAPLPPGADAVLQLEKGLFREGDVAIAEPVTLGKHVRKQGEDIRSGDELVSPGTRITTNSAGLLANAGVHQVSVTRRVRAAVVATGRELVSASQTQRLAPGQIFDSNGIVMRSMLRDAGCDVSDLGTVEDDPAEIADRISRGLNGDLLVISGGVSVGKYDYVKSVLKELGMERIFWRVRMKPGKPLLCGKLGDTWIFGLPGNPISCVAGIAAFIKPLLRKLEGERASDGTLVSTQGFIRARLAASISHEASRTLLATAYLSHDANGVLCATPTRVQGSAMMHTLAASNGFVVVPEGCPQLEAGEIVDALWA